jgi:hypothetical protein
MRLTKLKSPGASLLFLVSAHSHAILGLICPPLFQKVSKLNRLVDPKDIHYTWKNSGRPVENCFEYGCTLIGQKPNQEGRLTKTYKEGRSAKTFIIEATIGSGKKAHTINFYVEKPMLHRPLVDGPIDKYVEDTMTSIISSLPHDHIEVVKRIELIGSPERGNSDALAHADVDTIRYFDFKGKAPERFTNQHEFGHLLLYHFYGNYEPPLEYKRAAARDNVGVSAYGDTSWVEDFAEGFGFWMELKEKGRNLTAADKELLKKLKNRFAYFDKDKAILNSPYIQFNRRFNGYLTVAGSMVLGTASLAFCAKLSDERSNSKEPKKDPKNLFEKYCLNLF